MCFRGFRFMIVNLQPPDPGDLLRRMSPAPACLNVLQARGWLVVGKGLAARVLSFAGVEAILDCYRQIMN